MPRRSPQPDSRPNAAYKRFKNGSGDDYISAGCLLLRVTGPKKGASNYFADDLDAMLAFLQSDAIRNADKIDDQYFTRPYWETVTAATCGEPRPVLRADAVKGTHDQNGKAARYILREVLNCVGSCPEGKPCRAAGNSIKRDGCDCND